MFYRFMLHLSQCVSTGPLLPDMYAYDSLAIMLTKWRLRAHMIWLSLVCPIAPKDNYPYPNFDLKLDRRGVQYPKCSSLGLGR